MKGRAMTRKMPDIGDERFDSYGMGIIDRIDYTIALLDKAWQFVSHDGSAPSDMMARKYLRVAEDSLGIANDLLKGRHNDQEDI